MRNHFNQDEFERAANASLVDYLKQNGYELKKDGRNHRVTLPPENGVKRRIDVIDNRYIDRITGKGGYGIDFLMRIEGKSRVDAVLALCGERYGRVSTKQSHGGNDGTNPRQPLTLPDKAENSRRVYAYLVGTRHIDGGLVRQLLHNDLLYQSERFGNAVFVCRDEQGMARGASMRSTSSNPAYRFHRNAAGSDKTYPFMIKGDPLLAGSVRVFEGVIDMLSYMTLMKSHGEDTTCTHFIALGGVDARGLDRFLADNPDIKHIVLCLDNDMTGIKAMGQLAAVYEGRGYNVECDLPLYKDWNEDLVTKANGGYGQQPIHNNNAPATSKKNEEEMSI